MTWVTYKQADGGLVYGEYAWVTELEFFEELCEPIEVIKETWVLQSSETITVKPDGWDELQAENAADEAEQAAQEATP